MCDKFDRTIYLLLNQFSEKEPITIAEALEKIDDDDYYSMSLSVRPVTKFIQNNIAGSGYLTEEKGGYKLTGRGVKERNFFKNIIEKASEAA